MPDVASLQVVVSADTTAAESSLTGLGQKVSGVGSAITGALGGAAVAAVAGLGAAFVGSVKSAADFEKQMSAISAVSGATASEMEGLTATALQLGKDTSFSASEAAKGMEELAKAGVSTADIIGGAGRAALDLAAAGAVSVADAAEIASNAMNVFNIEGANMGHVTDVIAGAANASAISVTDYKFSLSAAGAVAATVGIGFESLSEAIAIMGQAGIKGSDAGTSLKTMLMNLQPSTKAQSEEFRRLGLETTNAQVGYDSLVRMGLQPMSAGVQDVMATMRQHLGLAEDTTTWTKTQRAEFDKLAKQTGLVSNAFFDETGSAKSMAQIAEVLKTSMAGMTDQQRLASLEILFGSDAVRAGAVLAKEGAAGFTKMAESMGKVSGQAVAEERLNNLWGSIEKLTGSLETGAIILGSLFTPALKAMADVMTGAVNAGIAAFTALTENWDLVVAAFTGGGPAIKAALESVFRDIGLGEWSATAVDGIDAVGVAWRTILLPAMQAVGAFVTGTLVPAFQAVGGFLAEHTELIAGLAAAWAAFAVISTVAGWILGAIAAFGAFSTAITAAGGVIAAIIAVIGGPLTLVILAIAAVIGVLTAAWIGNWGDIQGKTATAIAAITAAIQTGLTAIQGFWTAHGQQIMTIVTAFWTIITAQFTLAWTVLSGIITVGMQLLAGDWQAAWTTITTVAQAIWDSWATILTAVWTIITTLFGEQIAAVAAAWTAGWTAIETALQTAWTAIQGVVQAGWTAVAGIFTAAWNLLSVENQTRVTALITLITQLWTTLGQVWTTGTTAVTTLVTTWWTAQVTYWTTQTTAFVTFLTAWWADIVALWTKAQTEIAALIEPWWTTIKGYWDTALQAIKDALAAAWTWVVEQTTAVFTRIGEEFTKAKTSLGEMATSLGTAIMDLLITGINAKVQSMVDAVTDAVKKGLNAARSLIGGASGSSGNAAWDAIAREEGVDPALLASLIQQESGGNQGARSGAGAIGLTQLMPGTAASLGVDPNDPAQNVRGGARYLKQMLDMFGGDEQRALVAYNAGPGGGTPSASLAYAQRVIAGKANVPSGVAGAQRAATPQLNQFGMTGDSLTAAEAAAFCGPAAAMWFAGIYGRMPDKAEAEAMARSVGWTPEWGMTGPGSEQRLLALMGVASNVDYSPTPAEIGALAAQNVPFQLSTAGHFYQVQGGSLGGLNVGGSGVAAGGSATMSLDQIVALSGAINGIITLAPQMGAAMVAAGADGAQMGTALATAGQTGGAAVQTLGTTTTAMATSVQASIGTTGAMMVSMSQDALGNTTRIYTEAGAAIATTVTNTAGQIVNQWSAAGATVVSSTLNALGGQTTVFAEQTGQQVTIVTDATGQMVARYVEAGAAVVADTAASQAAIVASSQAHSGLVISMTQDMLGNTTRIYSDSMGVIATTVTDTGGTIVKQWSSTGTEIVSSTLNALGGQTTVFREQSGEQVTIVTDATGQIVQQFQTLGTDVAAAAETMASDVGESVNTLVSDVQESFGDVATASEDAVSALEGVGEVSIEAPDVGDIIDSMGDIEEAAKDAAKALEKVGDGDGGDGGDGDHRAKGGPVTARHPYLVGEQGPELFVPSASGEILTHAATRRALSGSGGGYGAGDGGTETIVLKIDIGGRIAEEIYVQGRELAINRGRR